MNAVQDYCPNFRVLFRHFSVNVCFLITSQGVKVHTQQFYSFTGIEAVASAGELILLWASFRKELGDSLALGQEFLKAIADKNFNAHDFCRSGRHALQPCETSVFCPKKTNSVQGLQHSLAFIADKLNQAREQCEYKTLVSQQVLCSGLSTEANNYIGVASRPIQTIFVCAITISYKCIKSSKCPASLKFKCW